MVVGKQRDRIRPGQLGDWTEWEAGKETGKTNEPAGRQEERNDGMQSWTGSRTARTGRGDE